MRKAFKGIGLSMLILFILVALYAIIGTTMAVVTCFNSEEGYYETQAERLDELEKSYASDSTTIDYNEFTSFNTNALQSDPESLGDPKLNDLKVIATHNSYKQGLNWASSFFFNYVAFFAEPDKGPSVYDYSFETLTSQLNNGIRSVELDLIKKTNDDEIRYQCIHNAMTDNQSSAIDFELALKEIAMWSEHNSDHMPITIIVETKPGFIPFIDSTADVTSTDLNNIESSAMKYFGDNLMTPADMLGTNEGFREMTENNDYPTLQDSRGKVILLLHDGAAMDDYIATTHNTPEQVFFPLLSYTRFTEGAKDGLDYTCFTVANSAHDTETLELLTANDQLNLIVRTRLNSYPVVYEGTDTVLASRAQIMSSDYPPRSTPAPDGNDYISYITGNKTISISTL